MKLGRPEFVFRIFFGFEFNLKFVATFSGYINLTNSLKITINELTISRQKKRCFITIKISQFTRTNLPDFTINQNKFTWYKKIQEWVYQISQLTRIIYLIIFFYTNDFPWFQNLPEWINIISKYELTSVTRWLVSSSLVLMTRFRDISSFCSSSNRCFSSVLSELRRENTDAESSSCTIFVWQKYHTRSLS